MLTSTMLPPGLTDFLVAMTTASASFIGLLFVAISFGMNADKDTLAEAQTKRILAESSYAGLLSIFFISLVALIPDTNVGWVIFVMAILGMGTIGHLLRTSTRVKYNKARLLYGGAIYTGQAAYGLYVILFAENHVINEYGFMTLMLFLFSGALERAWELTGIRK